MGCCPEAWQLGLRQLPSRGGPAWPRQASISSAFCRSCRRPAEQTLRTPHLPSQPGCGAGRCQRRPLWHRPQDGGHPADRHRRGELVLFLPCRSRAWRPFAGRLPVSSSPESSRNASTTPAICAGEQHGGGGAPHAGAAGRRQPGCASLMHLCFNPHVRLHSTALH